MSFNLYAFDIKRVIELLTPRYPNKIIIDRVLLNNENLTNVVCQKDIPEKLYYKYANELIDDFIKHTINSFDIFYISCLKPLAFSRDEVNWFINNHEARACLWKVINRLPIETSGKSVEYHRCQSTIWLAIPID